MSSYPFLALFCLLQGDGTLQASFVIKLPMSSGFQLGLANGKHWREAGGPRKRDFGCFSHDLYSREQLLQQWQSLPCGCPRHLLQVWLLPGDPRAWFLPTSSPPSVPGVVVACNVTNFKVVLLSLLWHLRSSATYAVHFLNSSYKFLRKFPVYIIFNTKVFPDFPLLIDLLHALKLRGAC